MDNKRVEYDADAKLVKVFRSFSSPKTLVPSDELSRWTAILGAGEDEQGRPVKAVRYIFEQEEAARYNQQPLSFAGFQTYLLKDNQEAPLGDDPKFSVREDFGIDGEGGISE